jgi:hypothetical protein
MRRVMEFVGEPFEEAWLQARLAEAAPDAAGAGAAGVGAAGAGAAAAVTTGAKPNAAGAGAKPNAAGVGAAGAGAAAAITTGAKPNAAGAITTGSLGRWRRDLKPHEIELIRQRATHRLVELRYAEGSDWA